VKARDAIITPATTPTAVHSHAGIPPEVFVALEFADEVDEMVELDGVPELVVVLPLDELVPTRTTVVVEELEEELGAVWDCVGELEVIVVVVWLVLVVVVVEDGVVEVVLEDVVEEDVVVVEDVVLTDDVVEDVVVVEVVVVDDCRFMESEAFPK